MIVTWQDLSLDTRRHRRCIYFDLHRSAIPWCTKRQESQDQISSTCVMHCRGRGHCGGGGNLISSVADCRGGGGNYLFWGALVVTRTLMGRCAVPLPLPLPPQHVLLDCLHSHSTSTPALHNRRVFPPISARRCALDFSFYRQKYYILPRVSLRIEHTIPQAGTMNIRASLRAPAVL